MTWKDAARLSKGGGRGSRVARSAEEQHQVSIRAPTAGGHKVLLALVRLTIRNPSEEGPCRKQAKVDADVEAVVAAEAAAREAVAVVVAAATVELAAVVVEAAEAMVADAVVA